jgi:hypothetical protein
MLRDQQVSYCLTQPWVCRLGFDFAAAGTKRPDYMFIPAQLSIVKATAASQRTHLTTSPIFAL